jgi:hypothetical protein
MENARYKHRSRYHGIFLTQAGHTPWQLYQDNNSTANTVAITVVALRLRISYLKTGTDRDDNDGYANDRQTRPG